MENNQDIEMLDVFDEENKRIIGIAERGVVHYYNLWHREISCWVVNENNEILLQRRSPNKQQQPNKLAITAGHVGLGETPVQALLREVSEEIGITDQKEEDFIYLDTFKAENINNYHFKYVYLLKTTKKITDFVLQESEVSELSYVSLPELEKMINSTDSELTFAKHFYTPIILKKIKDVLYSV